MYTSRVRILPGLMCLSVWVLAASFAQAQFGGSRFDRPLNRPTFSPYLNLFRSGSGASSTALNYYGQVRPQQQFYQQSQDLKQGLYSFQAPQRRQQTPQRTSRIQGVYTMGTTGHGVTFMSARPAQSGAGGIGGGLGQSGNSQFGSDQFGSNQFGSNQSGDNQFGTRQLGDGFGTQFGTGGTYSGHSAGFSSGGGFSGSGR